MTSPLLAAQGLCKWYGHQLVLDRVDLELAGGQFVALSGRNGAGKTTLLRVLAGLLKHERGELKVAGRAVASSLHQHSVKIAAVMHEPMLYGPLTARENLALFARLNRVPCGAEEVERAAARLGAGELLDVRVASLSNGNRKRIAIVRALMSVPRVLVLDEAEAGLDDHAMELLNAALRGFVGGGGAVVGASHHGDLYGGLATHRLVLERGRVAATAEARDG